MLSINKILPLAAAVMSATQSAAALTVLTDKVPAQEGTQLAVTTEITGKVQFKDVSFSYPLESKKQVYAFYVKKKLYAFCVILM
jgi:ABC-type multidrug transport system fused ATPase/permease subunit